MRLLLVSALLFLLSACGGSTVEPGAVVPTIMPDTAVWLTAEGNQTHRLSGIMFPARIKGYIRVNTKNFSSDGSDVGIVYKKASAGRGLVNEITLYATHVSKFSSGTLNAKLYADDAARSIQTRWKKAKYLQSGDLLAKANPFVEGPYHLFEVKLRGKTYRSGVWTKRHGDWFLKARFTYIYEETETDKVMSTLSKALQNEMGGKGVKIQATNKDGVALGMEHVVNLLTGVHWSE